MEADDHRVQLVSAFHFENRRCSSANRVDVHSSFGDKLQNES